MLGVWEKRTLHVKGCRSTGDKLRHLQTLVLFFLVLTQGHDSGTGLLMNFN